MDRWELNVGDSLIRNIEAAITNASAIVFVLSRASRLARLPALKNITTSVISL